MAMLEGGGLGRWCADPGPALHGLGRLFLDTLPRHCCAQGFPWPRCPRSPYSPAKAGRSRRHRFRVPQTSVYSICFVYSTLRLYCNNPPLLFLSNIAVSHMYRTLVSESIISLVYHPSVTHLSRFGRAGGMLLLSVFQRGRQTCPGGPGTVAFSAST